MVPADRGPLPVVLGIFHQYLLYEVMPARQEHAPRTNAEARERTILTGSLEQEAEKAGAELADVPPSSVPFGPRGSPEWVKGIAVLIPTLPP